MESSPERLGLPELIAYFADGEKSPDAWRIGTEHEKFGFSYRDLTPPEFSGETGIQALLEGLADRYGWKRQMEAGVPIALTRGAASISLEPAGQFELSGAAVADLHATASELHEHIAELSTVATPLGIGFLGCGFQPKWPRSAMPWMPKSRYKIMREYMPRVGTLGLDMMTRTCTAQVNLDFCSEADMVKKFRVGLALQPIATALFADSPFTEGQPNGYLSYRSHIWTDTDSDRTGMLDFVFDSGFGYERYIEYMLDVPMYFVRRNGAYIDVAGQSFRAFLDGTLPGLPGQYPSLEDWSDHLTTAFPEVRLKRFLEMRGADCGTQDRICALPAFWVGVLYDADALDAAWNLIRDFSAEERHDMRNEVPRHALATPFRQGTVRDLAREALKIANHGLARRARKNSADQDERIFLAPLQEIVDSGLTAAERKLERFKRGWSGNIDPIFSEFAFY